jgi:hypothetical protein
MKGVVKVPARAWKADPRCYKPTSKKSREPEEKAAKSVGRIGSGEMKTQKNRF